MVFGLKLNMWWFIQSECIIDNRTSAVNIMEMWSYVRLKAFLIGVTSYLTVYRNIN